jgi:hypothetical protein
MVWIRWWSNGQTLQTLPTIWSESADDLSARLSRPFLPHGLSQLMIYQPDSPIPSYPMVWVSWWSISQTLQTLPTPWSKWADVLSARLSRPFLPYGLSQLMFYQPDSPDPSYPMVWVSWWSISQTLQTLPTTWSKSADDLAVRLSRPFLPHGVNRLMIKQQDSPNTSYRKVWDNLMIYCSS